MKCDLNTKQISHAEQSNRNKWGKDVWNSGWTGIPNAILYHADALGLSFADIGIILFLASHWWHEDELSRPLKKRISKASALTPRSIQRKIAHLEAKGYVKRIMRYGKNNAQLANYYDLSGLIEAVQALERRGRTDTP